MQISNSTMKFGFRKSERKLDKLKSEINFLPGFKKK